ncbi:MAG: glycosyltransferase family 87 protein, partial [Anaerolineae bacterium]
ANLLLRQGWRGGLGQIIGSDFVTLYAAGLLYRTDITHLYDFTTQGNIQQALIHPTVLRGVNPYISPPYVAWAYSALTFLPLTRALVAWTLVSLLFIALAVHLGTRFLAPSWLVRAGLSRFQAFIILISSFAFVEGLQVGQNHGLTLLLVTGITVSTLSGRWYTAGALAGFLLYKPQFALGFLILWVVWRKYQALVSFAGISGVWAGIVLFSKGFDPYQSYLTISDQVLRLPYVEGFPGFLMVTPYGLLATLLPQAASSVIQAFIQILTLAISVGFVWFAYRRRNAPPSGRKPALVLALLYPLLATPYALLHDLLVLFPVFLLLPTDRSNSTYLLHIAVATYFGVFILPPLAYLSGVAYLAFIPIGVLVMQLRQIWVSERRVYSYEGRC